MKLACCLVDLFSPAFLNPGNGHSKIHIDPDQSRKASLEGFLKEHYSVFTGKSGSKQ